MTETEKLYDRISKIETNIAVLAASSVTRDKQLEIISNTLAKHIEKEERVIERIFAKLDDTKNTCDGKHVVVGEKLAKYDGAILGSKWILAIISVFTSISLFLGFKGLK